MLHLCPIQSGFDIISTPGGVVNGFLSILQRKPLAFSFLWGSQTFDHFSGADQRPRRGRSRPKAPPESGVDRLTVPVSGLPAWWGRSPLGVPFDWPKGTKSHLGRSPLRTSLGYEVAPASRLCSARPPCCGAWSCHHTRLPWAAGSTTRQFPHPGLPWKSGVPAAGSRAPDSWEQRHTRVRPWGQKDYVSEK